MFWDYPLLTSANTTQANASEFLLPFRPGVVKRVNVHFPRGCKGLVHVQILDGLTHLWPQNANDDFATDGETIFFEEHYVVKRPAPFFRAIVWNLDDTYEHRPRVRFLVLEEEYAEPVLSLVNVLNTIKRMFRLEG